MKEKKFQIRKFMNKESSAGIVFCLPFIIGFLLFLIVPMGLSLYYSFVTMIFFLHHGLQDWIIILKCLPQMKPSGSL